MFSIHRIPWPGARRVVQVTEPTYTVDPRLRDALVVFAPFVSAGGRAPDTARLSAMAEESGAAGSVVRPVREVVSVRDDVISASGTEAAADPRELIRQRLATKLDGEELDRGVAIVNRYFKA